MTMNGPGSAGSAGAAGVPSSAGNAGAPGIPGGAAGAGSLSGAESIGAARGPSSAAGAPGPSSGGSAGSAGIPGSAAGAPGPGSARAASAPTSTAPTSTPHNPPPPRSGLTRTRIAAGTVLAAVGLLAATFSLVEARDDLSLASVTLIYLACVVAVAVVGGVWPALAAAVASAVLVNYFFVPRFHTFAVDGPDYVITLLVYVTVAATVAIAMDLAARQRASAARHGVEARELAEIDRLRAALLAAVGHDLRTPLAGSKAAVSSLRDPDLAITGAQADELLGTIEESTDRMSALVENLLAMSRLQAGALSVSARPVALDEVVASALLHESDVDVDVPEDLPPASADPGLIERVIVNLVDNARRAGPPVRVTADADGEVLRVRVVDSGPGVADADKERIFSPFQRLHDHTADGGLGLGLAIARGFTEAMGGTLEPGDTPGGGLTMTVTLPVATR